MSATDPRAVKRITQRGVHFMPFIDQHGQMPAVLVGREGHVIGYAATRPGETTEQAAARLWAVLPTLERPAPARQPESDRPIHAAPPADASQAAMLRFLGGARSSEPN